MNTGKMYGCPRCNITLKLSKDYKRHVVDTCYKLQSFRCPDCSKTFTRKHRLAKHHKKDHPNRCFQSECTHVEQATVRASGPTALGCGFCGILSTSVSAYLQHLIHTHFKSGQTLADWSYDKQILSLLSQPAAANVWKELHTTRFGDSGQMRPHWPSGVAKKIIDMLEHNPTPATLQHLLPTLLVSAEWVTPHNMALEQEWEAYAPPRIDIDVVDDQSPFSAMLSTFGTHHSGMAQPVAQQELLTSPYTDSFNRPASLLSTSRTLLNTPIDGKTSIDIHSLRSEATSAVSYDSSGFASFDHSLFCSPVDDFGNVQAQQDPFHTCLGERGINENFFPWATPQVYSHLDEPLIVDPDTYIAESNVLHQEPEQYEGPIDFDHAADQTVFNPTPPIPTESRHKRNRSSGRLSRIFQELLPMIKTSDL